MATCFGHYAIWQERWEHGAFPANDWLAGYHGLRLQSKSTATTAAVREPTPKDIPALTAACVHVGDPSFQGVQGLSAFSLSRKIREQVSFDVDSMPCQRESVSHASKLTAGSNCVVTGSS